MAKKIELPKFLTKLPSSRTDPLKMPSAVKEAVERSERGNKLTEKERDVIGKWLLLFPNADMSNSNIARAMAALRIAAESGILPATGRVDLKGKR